MMIMMMMQYDVCTVILCSVSIDKDLTKYRTLVFIFSSNTHDYIVLQRIQNTE
jgi:hypothetical protein